MEFRKSTKVKKNVDNVFTLKGKRVKTNKVILQDDTTLSFRPDYFARYRFNIDELCGYLSKSSGQLYSSIPFLFQYLDDMGHWSLVRQSEIFKFTSSLEEKLRLQFKMLERVFSYNDTDILLWADIRSKGMSRQLVKIEEQINKHGEDLYRVQALNSGATFLVSRDELDYWNASGSTLPVDHLIEVIDWNRDLFWLKKLNDFKIKMVEKNFNFTFSNSEEGLIHQRQQVVDEIKSFFNLSEGELNQSKRGLGILSCGNGSAEQSQFIFAMALQALGQVFGISSRLWGKVDDKFEVNPSFLLYSTSENKNISEQSLIQKILLDQSYKPIQRTQNEVMRRVMAKGPFGHYESLGLLRTNSEYSDEKETKEVTSVKIE